MYGSDEETFKGNLHCVLHEAEWNDFATVYDVDLLALLQNEIEIEIEMIQGNNFDF